MDKQKYIVQNASPSEIRTEPVDRPWTDFSKDPFVVKKREEALALLKEHPLPESFKKKKV
jgi:hypothetical protein